MRAVLLACAMLNGARATPCAGDPAHQIGESWLCDNQCDTCTCLDDGTISAAGGVGCHGGGDDGVAAEQQFEATVVRMAMAFALVFLVCCLGVCFMLCVKGGSKQASAVVRELEDADNM